ncbi:BRI1 kinase inhibitor 1-like [Arachis stenosperma]|uniref:BRI1 kinase inhibitor 1-like n=1 Tax=Arachis stenosperma TaxID=217475 RepID=UPI0025ABA759|nr:BRI1 kinase inhibitor 1-like [Arachis stenosperma]
MASFQQERNRVEEEEEEVASSKLVSNSNQSCSSPPSNNTSSSSSPSHEFSFTISLNSHHHHHHHHHHSSFTNTNNNIFNSTNNNNNNIDLSPADEIFFHGHLLPLHLLSHLPQSPRSSSNSMDSFTLPIRELLEDENVNPIKENGTSNNIICNNNNKEEGGDNKKNSKGNKLFKPSFSLFGLKKGLKGSSKVREKEEKENHKKKRLNFDVIHDAMKKYLRMVQQPLVLFRRRSNSISRDKYRINGKSSYSYSSGNVTPNSNKDLFRGYWNQYSAPASMRTSPTNSGLLVPTPTTLHSSHGARDSTMEELQAAIQAAIAHCKNSIAKEEKKLKCSDIRSGLI